jgi:hypothetical protein
MSLVFLFILFIFIIRPLTQEKKIFQIEDKCGPFMGSLVHTVANKDICEMRCTSQCDTNDFHLKKIEFVDNGLKCHDCTCICVR